MLSSCHSARRNTVTPKIPAKFASLNSSFAFGDLRLGGCLRGSPPQAPARAQSPTHNTRMKRRKFRGSFVGYFGILYQNQRFIPQNFNLRFELKDLIEYRDFSFPARACATRAKITKSMQLNIEQSPCSLDLSIYSVAGSYETYT